VPDWFAPGLQPLPLDGEFWIDRKAFQQTAGIVRRQDKTDLVRFLIFDAPDRRVRPFLLRQRPA
jgi:DNA ligase-1